VFEGGGGGAGLWLLLGTSCTTDQDLINVVDQRIQALKKKDLDGYLKADYYYVADTDKMTETLPKVVWDKEKERLRQKYKTRFDETINQTPMPSGTQYNLNPGGVFLCPGMRSKILEVHRASNIVTRDGKTMSGSRVYVQCEFSDKNQSPYTRYTYYSDSTPKYTPQGKPLKKTIVAFSVVTSLSKPTIVDTSEVVEGRDFW